MKEIKTMTVSSYYFFWTLCTFDKKNILVRDVMNLERSFAYNFCERLTVRFVSDAPQSNIILPVLDSLY